MKALEARARKKAESDAAKAAGRPDPHARAAKGSTLGTASAPKRRGRPPGKRPQQFAPNRGATIAGVTAKVRASMVEVVEEGLQLVEFGVYIPLHIMVTPRDAFDGDKLEGWERNLLAETLVDEGLRYPRIKGWLLKAVELRTRSSLPMVVMVLALPRLAAHGVIPNELTGLVSDLREAVKASRRQRVVDAADQPAQTPPRPYESNGADGPPLGEPEQLSPIV